MDDIWLKQKNGSAAALPLFCMIIEIYLIVSTSKTSSHSFSA